MVLLVDTLFGLSSLRRIFRNMLNGCGSTHTRTVSEEDSLPRFITVFFGERRGTRQAARDAPRQSQWMGTNAWHRLARDVPTAALATSNSRGSVRGESPITQPTSSKHLQPAYCLHTGNTHSLTDLHLQIQANTCSLV